MAAYRNHSVIISEAGGVPAVRRALASRGHDLPDQTVRAWVTRNSIPKHYWADFTALGFTTLAELIGAVAKKPEGNGAIVVSFPPTSSIVGRPPQFLPPLSHRNTQQTTRIAPFFSGQPSGELVRAR